jgi:hypothetical protein
MYGSAVLVIPAQEWKRIEAPVIKILRSLARYILLRLMTANHFVGTCLKAESKPNPGYNLTGKRKVERPKKRWKDHS